jgi:hypothetical protein
MPEMGYTRQGLTDCPLKVWNVYSYLIVYDPATSPLAVLAIIHGAQDVEQLLKKHLTTTAAAHRECFDGAHGQTCGRRTSFRRVQSLLADAIQ